LLGRFLEGQRARDLEGHLRGVDLVIAAVVEPNLHIHYREAGQDAPIQRFADARLDGLDELLGDRAAGDVVLEDEALAGPRLDLDVADSVLPMAARLLDVPAHALGR